MEQTNQIGALGESLATTLMPSATLQPSTGFDLVGLNGDKIEVKTSRYSEKRNGWRFRLSYQQVILCDHVLLLALDPKGLLSCYWLIPGDELRHKEIVINGFNLADWAKYLVEVRHNGNR